MNKNDSQENGKRRKQKILVILLALVAVIACVIAVWAVINMNAAKQNANEPAADAEQTAETEAPTTKTLTDSIALPQMAWINLDAEKTEQAKTFTNPAENFAQFRVTIFMDSEVLWQSAFLKPGETSAPMVLRHALSPGEYDANLIYECFTNDAAKTPLNGANSPITLKVY